MRAVFLSDAHLWNDRDEGYGRLLHFFNELRGQIDLLVVAGDLFDFWFCDENNLFPEFRPMVEALVDLKEYGADIFFIEGNHDFFLEPALAEKGIKICRDEAVLELDGWRTYVAHGDLVDNTNRRYLFLRRVLRSDLFYVLQKRIPSALLWRIAQVSSNSSRKYQKKDPKAIVAVMNAFARRKIACGIDAVILGHSHQPLLERIDGGDRQGVLALLGDWIDHYSYLVFEDGLFSLKFYDRKR